MRIQITATLATLFLATACTATTSGSGVPDPDTGDAAARPAPNPYRAEAGPPPEEDTVRCGGFPFNDKACGTCGASRCCTAAATCMDDTECHALTTCVSSCSGDSTCLERCATLHSAGVSKYNSLGSCVDAKCSTECKTAPPPTAPASKGIGDRCTRTTDCRDGVCNASGGEPGWCTTYCSENYDCKGYPQLNNQYGKLNYCIKAASGSSTCFPGCSTNADCNKYGITGLTCQSAGSGVYVCAM